MPRLSAFRIVVAGTAMVAGAAFSPAAARAQGDATALTPLKSRTSDAVIAGDYHALTAMQERLLAARRNRPTLPQYPFEKAPFPYALGTALLFVFLIATIGANEANAFIYFQF